MTSTSARFVLPIAPTRADCEMYVAKTCRYLRNAGGESGVVLARLGILSATMTHLTEAPKIDRETRVCRVILDEQVRNQQVDDTSSDARRHVRLCLCPVVVRHRRRDGRQLRGVGPR